MMAGLSPVLPMDAVQHIIQVALTPIFLLTGIGTLLNLFNTRLARVADHIEHTADLLESCAEEDSPLLRTHLRRLGHRMLVLDAAMLLGALGGASTCAACFALFLGALRDQAAAALLVLFALGLGGTVASLAAFIGDTVLAWHGVRRDGPLPHIRRSG
jgi:hypothetical protein